MAYDYDYGDDYDYDYDDDYDYDVSTLMERKNTHKRTKKKLLLKEKRYGKRNIN